MDVLLRGPTDIIVRRDGTINISGPWKDSGRVLKIFLELSKDFNVFN